MARRRTWSWRNIIKKPISVSEHGRIYLSLETAPDRVVALVCGSLLERALEQAIASRLKAMPRKRYKEIFDSGGVILGLQSKIRMGYALSLFGDKTYADLDRVREIRNVFAHTAHTVKFTTPRIASHCNKLALSQGKPLPIIYTLLGWLDIHPPTKEISALKPPDTPRRRYIYATILLEGLISGYSRRPVRPRRPTDMFVRRYLG